MFRVILLCLLTCCSSFMPLKHSESIISEDHIQVVEKKTKENFVQTSSGYREYGLSDLLSYEFLVGLGTYLADNYSEDLSYNNNNVVSNYVISTSNVYQVFYYDETTRNYTSAYYVSNLVINKSIQSGDTSDNPVLWYSFIFGNSSPYDKQIKLGWCAQRVDYNRLTIWGAYIETTSALNSFGSTIYWYARFMLSEYFSGYNAFIGIIFDNLKSDPYNNGYNVGYRDGYTAGYDAGDEVGYDTGYSVGQTNGYTTGYNTGVSDTIASGSEAMTIFAGIMDVAFIPVNVFFLMFDYEVFGINIAGFVSGLLTIAIVIILMRFIFGRKV